MAYTLTPLPNEPVWVMTLFGVIEVRAVEDSLEQATETLSAFGRPCGLMIDWRGALPLGETQISHLIALVGEWMVTLPLTYPVFLVFLCHDEGAREIARSLQNAGLMLPIFANPEEGHSYLNLKVASATMKENIANPATQLLDPSIRLQLIAAAQEARAAQETQEQDETDRFPSRGVLRLEAAGMDKSILVFPEKGGVLGRRDSKGQKPDVDLSLWSGFHSGVSRRHAEIRVGDDGLLYLIDLESTNGTYLNGIKVEPDDPQPVNTGDEVRLGSLIMHVYFHTGD